MPRFDQQICQSNIDTTSLIKESNQALKLLSLALVLSCYRSESQSPTLASWVAATADDDDKPINAIVACRFALHVDDPVFNEEMSVGQTDNDSLDSIDSPK